MSRSAPSDATFAVGIHSVTKRFGDVTAVDDVSFDVADGEFFAMLGPSGCGKTTMLRMIAGLDFPTSGSISIHGREVADTPPHKRPVNTVFQHYALFPHLDVGENVEFGLRMQRVGRKERRSRSADALSLVRLDGLERRTPAQLSGGQQQRVALARALVNRPEVLLLDEPLGALDLKLRQQMQTELKSLQRELGITFVFVTHDQEEALTMSDRIAVMRDGEVLQIGSASDIYEHPADRFVAEFIGRINVLDATVAAPDVVALENGARLDAATDGRRVGSKVGIALRPERARLTVIEPGAEPTTDGHTVAGVITATTYLGNAIVYQVTVDWLHIDVRVENVSDDRLRIGSDVLVSWDPSALVVLVGDGPTAAVADGSADPVSA